MNRRNFIHGSSFAGAAAMLCPVSTLAQVTVPALPPAGADGWISLLNGHDLSGWYSMIAKGGKGVAEKRKMVVMEEGMLHIMGNEESGDEKTGVVAEPGYLATNQEFENVHIRVEYKWGMKRFAPRNLAKRDNGILYGLVGPDKVWPTCVECQIEEGDVGDYFMVGTRGVQDEHFNGFLASGLARMDGGRVRNRRCVDILLPRRETLRNPPRKNFERSRMGTLRFSTGGIQLR